MRAIAMTRCPPWLTDLPGERSGRRSMVAKQVFYGFSQRLQGYILITTMAINTAFPWMEYLPFDSI